MASHNGFDLADLYLTATAYTNQATERINQGDEAAAFAYLEKRKMLVRVIQREMSQSPAWGEDSRVDAAALRYIEADKQLAQALFTRA